MEWLVFIAAGIGVGVVPFAIGYWLGRNWRLD